MNFGVNHVGHFMLTELLLPLLKTWAPSRIVVVSSNMHASGRIDFDDLAMEKTWSGSYPRSKLANMLFVRALSRRLDGTRVVVNGLHPGVIATELARDYPASIRLIAKWFFKSPELAIAVLHLLDDDCDSRSAHSGSSQERNGSVHVVGVDGIEEVVHLTDGGELLQHERAVEVSLVHHSLPGSTFAICSGLYGGGEELCGALDRPCASRADPRAL